MSEDIVDAFPHNDFRFSQKEIIRKIDELKDSGIKYFFIQAATGTGKTAVAGTVGKHLGPSYYLAEQKIHQDQVMEEFPDATEICKGHLNFHCGEKRQPPCKDSVPVPSINCDYKPSGDASGEFAGESAERGELYWPEKRGPGGVSEEERCEYMDHKTRSMKAEIACLNYSYFFNETYYSGDFGERRVLICDEAHNIEDNMQSFLTFRIDDFVQEELGLTLEDRGGHIEDWADWISNHLETAAGARLGEIDERITEMWDADDMQWRRKPNADLLYNRDTLDEVICNIHRFENEYFDGLEWAVEREYDDDGNLESVKFSPVTVAPFAKRFLFDYADIVILMSATMRSHHEEEKKLDVLLRSLGLSNDKDKCWFFNVGSLFPSENRKVFYYDGPKVNNDTWEKSFPKICKMIDRIAVHKHPQEKGIIHSVSYKNEEAILENVSQQTKNRLMYHHVEKDRDEVLEKFKESDGNQILMSPAMYEGVDLKYDMSRFQIIPKVPFLSLGSKKVQIRKDIDPQWYNWKTAIRLIQSLGRSVRAPDDSATTYILDGSFSWFYDRYGEMFFPEYLTEGQEGNEPAIEEGNLMELLGITM